MLVEVTPFEHHVLAHDQSMGSHFFQAGKDAVHVLVGVHEGDHYRQLAAGVDQVANPIAISSFLSQ
jgi:hypothetical protein